MNYSDQLLLDFWLEGTQSVDTFLHAKLAHGQPSHCALRSFYISIVHLYDRWAAFLPLPSDLALIYPTIYQSTNHSSQPLLTPVTSLSTILPVYTESILVHRVILTVQIDNTVLPLTLPQSPYPGPIATHSLS
jgi:hypothetical protein